MKTINIKDVKMYLSVASIARDGMLIVRRNDPLVPSTELIIVPRSVYMVLLLHCISNLSILQDIN